MTITIENEASKELPFDYKALIERVVMGCMDYEKCPYEAEDAVYQGDYALASLIASVITAQSLPYRVIGSSYPL